MSPTLGQSALQPLSTPAMQQAIERIMTDAVPADDVRAFLTVLAKRGETAEEIVGAVHALRRHAVILPLSRPMTLCDTCGTGGDGQGTFNISTLAALTVAACGTPVAKHGNRAASGSCGSADVLEALGLDLNAEPARVAASIETLNFGFCFALRFHPAVKTVAQVRKELGIRTIFNLVGPLANPARPVFQLVGVSQSQLMMPMARALQTLGIQRALVVHGADGLDELTTSGETAMLDVSPTAIAPSRFLPEHAGLARAPLEALRGGDVQTNARIAREVLTGQASAKRDVVALNAGCVLFLAGRADTIRQGVDQAQTALSSGSAQRVLDHVVECSRRRT